MCNYKTSFFIITFLFSSFLYAADCIKPIMPSNIEWNKWLDEVQIEAMRYLPYMVCLPFACLAAFMFDGIYIGATRTAVMRDMMAVSLVIYMIAAPVLTPFFHNHGLWMALLISFIARGGTLAFRYREIEASLKKL